MSTEDQSTPVWDLPLRLFHWSLVAGVPAAWLTFEAGWMEWHGRIGYALLALVIFRAGWGLWGSVHARFSDFLAGPGGVLRYLRGERAPGPGHNPLGGWSVVAMLALLLVQAATGLFNTDELLYQGPLYRRVDADLARRLGEIHATAFYLLAALVALHLVAIAWYQCGRKQRLVGAMISGHKPGIPGRRPPAPLWLAALTLAASAAIVWWLVSLRPAPVVWF